VFGNLLKSLHKAYDKINQERKKSGNGAILLSWEQKPAYRAATRTLDWAVREESLNETNIQYCARVLGRKGVMEANLSGPADEA